MKKSLLLLFLFVWFAQTSFSQWTQKADFRSGPRSGCISFSIGNKGYVGLGGLSGYFNKDIYAYIPGTDRWTQKSDFPGGARYNATAFSIGNKGYVGLGWVREPDGTDHYFKDFWEYDTLSDTWSQKKDFPGCARCNAVGFSIGEKGYVGTGECADGNTNDFWEYNPASDSWTLKDSCGGGPRNGATGFSIGNKGYIGFGLGGSPKGKDLWEYDTLSNTWTQKKDFPGTGKCQVAAFVINNIAYIGTGKETTGKKEDTQDFWKYDPVTDSWSQISDFPDNKRCNAKCFVINNKAYVGTGQSLVIDYNNDSYKTYVFEDLWEYDPVNEKNGLTK